MANEPASMRTARGRIRYLGSARSGAMHDWYTRLTAIALVPLTIAFIWLVLSLIGKDYNAVRSELGSTFPALLMLLFIFAGIFHMKLGVQTILEDYVRNEPAKTIAQVTNLFFAICVGLACIYAVLRIGFF
jgi:succinate dehydrogenase / fumarate reductase membrane anchor subunit